MSTEERMMPKLTGERSVLSKKSKKKNTPPSWRQAGTTAVMSLAGLKLGSPSTVPTPSPSMVEVRKSILEQHVGGENENEDSSIKTRSTASSSLRTTQDYQGDSDNEQNDGSTGDGEWAPTPIPFFDKSGVRLLREQRMKIAHERGICLHCGAKTRFVSGQRISPVNSDDVFKGVCIQCNPSQVPSPILANWKSRNNVEVKKSHFILKRRSARRMDTSYHSIQPLKQRSWSSSSETGFSSPRTSASKSGPPRRGINRHLSDGNVGGKNSPKLVALMKCLSSCEYESFFESFEAMSSNNNTDIVTCMKAFRRNFVGMRSMAPLRAKMPSGERWVHAICSKTKATDEEAVVQCLLTLLTLAALTEKYCKSVARGGGVRAAYYVLNSVQQGFSRAREIAMTLINYVNAQDAKFVPNLATIRQFGIILMSPLATHTTKENAVQALYHTARQLDESSSRYELIRKVLTKKKVLEILIEKIVDTKTNPATLTTGLELLWRLSYSNDSAIPLPAGQRIVFGLMPILSQEQLSFEDLKACCGVLANFVNQCPLSPANSIALCESILEAVTRPEFLVDGGLALEGAHVVRNLMAAPSEGRDYLGQNERCLLLVIDWLAKFSHKLPLLATCGDILAHSDPMKVLEVGGLERLLQAWQALDLFEGEDGARVRCSFVVAFASLSRLDKPAIKLGSSPLMQELVHLAEDDGSFLGLAASGFLRNFLIATATQPVDVTVLPGLPSQRVSEGRMFTEQGALKIYEIMRTLECSETVQCKGLRILCDGYYSKAMTLSEALHQDDFSYTVMTFSERHHQVATESIRSLMRSHKGKLGIQGLCCQVMHNLLIPFCSEEMSPRDRYLWSLLVNPIWHDLLDIFDDLSACQSIPTMREASKLCLALVQFGDLKFSGLIFPELLVRVARATRRFGHIGNDFGLLLSEGILAFRANGGTFNEIDSAELVPAALWSVVSKPDGSGAEAVLSWDEATLEKVFSDIPLEVVEGLCGKATICELPSQICSMLQLLVLVSKSMQVEILVRCRDVFIAIIEVSLDRFSQNEEATMSSLALAEICVLRSEQVVRSINTTDGVAAKLNKAMTYHLGSRHIQLSCCRLANALLRDVYSYSPWKVEPFVNCILAHLKDEEVQLVAYDALIRLAPLLSCLFLKSLKDAMFYGIILHFNQAQVVSGSLQALYSILLFHQTRPDLSDLQLSLLSMCLRCYPLHGEVQMAVTNLIGLYAGVTLFLQVLHSRQHEILPLLVRAAVNFPLSCFDSVQVLVSSLSEEFSGYNDESKIIFLLKDTSALTTGRTCSDLSEPVSNPKEAMPIVAKVAKGKEEHKPPNLKKQSKGGRKRKKGTRKRRSSRKLASDGEGDGDSDCDDSPRKPLNNKASPEEGQNILVDKMAFIQSSPLIKGEMEGRLYEMGRLSIAAERRMMKQALHESGLQNDCIFDIATFDRLAAIFAREDITIMHISGHGHPDYLVIEDEWGGPLTLSSQQVREWISIRQSHGTKGGLRLVFISACYSKEIASAFVEGGVPHVICCGRQDRIRTDTTLPFQKTFWRAFAGGHTIKSAFEHAKAAVRNSGLLTVEELQVEMEKFHLLQDGTDHESSRLRAVSADTPRARVLAKPEELWTMPGNFVGRQVEAYRVVRGLRNSRLLRVFGDRKIGKKTLVKYVCHYINDRRHIQDVDKIIWLPSVISGADEPELSGLFDRLSSDNVKPENQRRLVIQIIHRLVGRRLILVLEARWMDDVHEFLELVIENTHGVKIILIGSKEDVKEHRLLPCNSVDVEVGPLGIEPSFAFFFYVRSTMKVQTQVEAEEERILHRKLLMAHATNRLWRKELESIIGDGNPNQIRSAALKLSDYDLKRLHMIGDRDPCVLTFRTRAELVQKERLLLRSLVIARQKGNVALIRKLHGIYDDLKLLKDGDEYPDRSTLKRRQQDYEDEKDRCFEMGFTDRAIENMEREEAVKVQLAAEDLATNQLLRESPDFEDEPIYTMEQLDELIACYSAKKRSAFDQYDVSKARESTERVQKFEEKKRQLTSQSPKEVKWYMKLKL